MLLSIASNLISALLGFWAKHFWTGWRQQRQRAGQAAILSGLDSEAKFVFPPREDVQSLFLPRVSTEDFMAINNLISAFLSAGFQPPQKVADSKQITEAEKRQFNLVVICSSKTNQVTQEALSKLKEMYPRQAELIPEFAVEPATHNNFIRWNNGIYPSESFDQKGPDFTDIALILKSRSPWAAQRRILVVAGIRGFGTWGAAEFLKKSNKILRAKKGEPKDGDFAALVKVGYRECDIKEVSLLHLVDLPTEAASER